MAPKDPDDRKRERDGRTAYVERFVLLSPGFLISLVPPVKEEVGHFISRRGAFIPMLGQEFVKQAFVAEGMVDTFFDQTSSRIHHNLGEHSKPVNEGDVAERVLDLIDKYNVSA